MDTKKKIEQVDKNYEYFKKHLDGIYADKKDKFVLIKDQEFVGYFSSQEDALEAGNLKYEDGLFSVQKVTKDIIHLGFNTYILTANRPA